MGRNLDLDHDKVATTEDLYYEVFDKNPGLVAISDPDTGLHIDVNDSWLTALGYSRNDVIGKTVADFGLWQDSDQRAELVSLLLRDGHIKNFDVRFLRKDRTVCHVLVSGRVITFQGHRRFLLIGQDVTKIRQAQEDLRRSHDDLELQITERTAQLHSRIEEYRFTQAALEESEQRFRAFANTASDWYWESDQSHAFTWFSDGALKIDIAPNDVAINVVIGKTRWNLAEEDTNTEKWYAHQAAVDAHRPFRNFEYMAKVLYRGIVWISASGDPVFDADGIFVGYRGSARDITGRKLIQKKIEEAHQTAEKASLAKSDFLAHMSHEFRTPLNAILGFSQLLEMQIEDGATFSQQDREYVAHIVNSGEHLLSLVNNVLDLSKIEAGGMEIDVEPYAIDDGINHCIGIVQEQADGNNISIKTESLSDASIVVSADPLRFRQVILNLLSNAIKYNRPGGMISVTCEARKPEGTGRISIQDNGRGISQDFQKTLFDPFTRDQSIRRHVDGAGIGLTISREIVQKMGGAIGFESTEGEGTTFWVDLPLARDCAS